VACVDANHGWAVGYDGTIVATTDGGATWTAQTSGTTNTLIWVSFVDANHGWAVGEFGTIVATTDGGASWTAQTSGTTNHLYGVFFVDASHGWAVGTGGTIRGFTSPPAPTFAFTGFLGPVDNAPVVNSVRAGAAVPVKFSLGGDHGLDILAPDSPSSQRVACTGGAPTDAIEETVTASNSGLQYDPITDLYTYVWKTNKSWAGTCHQLTVKLSDGTSHVAHFQFRS
jgi:photosynthesis system II assembly factor YCF48-like protein